MYHINTTYEIWRFAGDFEGVIYYEYDYRLQDEVRRSLFGRETRHADSRRTEGSSCSWCFGCDS